MNEPAADRPAPRATALPTDAWERGEGYDAQAAGAVDFRSLMAALGQEVGGPLEAPLGLVCIELNGVDFMLAHGDTWGPDHLCVACEFGPVPEARRLEVLEAAMTANGDMRGFWSPVFSLEPATGGLMLTAALPLPGLEAKALLSIMMSYVSLAQQWRDAYLLRVE